MLVSDHDPIQQIPDPETIRRLIDDSVRRTELLRGMLRLARRKSGSEQSGEVHPAAGGKAVPDAR
jgi:hypothetical protein